MRFLPSLRPKLRIFLSADIVGSTAFKQRTTGAGPRRDVGKITAQPEKLGAQFDSSMPSWLTPLANFYRAIDRKYAGAWLQYETHAPQMDWPIGPKPELWKGNGDEVIYSKELNDHREAFVCIYLWIETIKHFRSDLVKLFPLLDVKATAWLSGFPLMNTEVIFYKERPLIDEMDTGDDVFYNYYLLEQFYRSKSNRAKLVRDFVGPSIDTGFRLCSHSTARKFVLSVDLMYMLSFISTPPKYFSRKLVYRYDGRHQFKGVLSGNPYPIFWIDMLHDDDLLAEEDKLNGPGSISKDDIFSFCEKFIESHEEYIIKPFINGDKESRFSSIPDHLYERLVRLNEEWPKRKQRHEIEVKSLRGEDIPLVTPASEGEPLDAEIDSFSIGEITPSHSPSRIAKADTKRK